MKKVAAVLLALAMIFAVVACAQPDTPAPTPAPAPDAPAPDAPAPDAPPPATDTNDEPFHILLVNALVGHPVYEQQAEGARRAAADFGVNLEIIGPSLGGDLVADTIEFMDMGITINPDAIITEPWDASMNAAIQRIYDAGIPNFITSNLPDNPDHFIAFIGTDNFNYGVVAADMIAAQMGGTANVVIGFQSLEATNQVEQAEGFESRIAEAYPGINIVTKVQTRADMAVAMQVFEESFMAYPEIDVVWMVEATGGPAAAMVAREMNREMIILDIDAVEQTVALIAEGEIWATLAQNFFKRGYEIVRMAYEYLHYGNADSFEKYNDSGVVLITQATVDTYIEDLWAVVRFKGTPMR